MNRRESFRYAWCLFVRRSSIVTIIFLSLAFGWMIRSALSLKDLWLEMSQSVEIWCMNSENGVSKPDEIRKEDNCLDMTEYRESAGTLIFQGYSTQVIFVGMEREYLERKYKDRLAVSLESTMPYLILDVSVLESMKNEKKESMPVVSPEEYVLQHFETDGGKTARVCAVVDEQEEQAQNSSGEPLYVYTTLEGYEMLFFLNNTLYTGNSGTGDGTIDCLESDGIGDGTTDSLESAGIAAKEAAASYLIELKNGFQLSRVISSLESAGLSVMQNGENDPFLQAEDWKQIQEKGKRNLCFAAIVLICTMILCRYQKQTLDIQYSDFWNYIRQYGSEVKIRRRIWHQHNFILGFSGMVGGMIFYFCMMLMSASKG